MGSCRVEGLLKAGLIKGSHIYRGLFLKSPSRQKITSARVSGIKAEAEVILEGSLVPGKVCPKPSGSAK